MIRDKWQTALLALFILVPNFDSVFKYLGYKGLVGYSVLGTAVVFAFTWFIFPKLEPKFSERTSIILMSVIFLVLAVYCAVIYPLATSGYFGPGSDAGDAMIIGARAMINGKYPFYEYTFLGNGIAPLPGALMIAIPFVATGLFMFQNLVWLGVFALVVRRQLLSATKSLFLLCLVLGLSPSIAQNLATGTDHITNTVYILLAMWLLIRSVSDENASEIWRILPSVFLGVGLSSRSNFIFLMPLLFMLITYRTNFMTAFKYLAIAGVTFLAVTIPFWLYDPANFTPMIIQTEKMKQFDGIIPHAGYILAGTSMVLAWGLAMMRSNAALPVFLRNCAIIQLYVVLFSSALHSILTGKLSLFFGHIGYGLFALFFGVFGAWIALNQPEENAPPENVAAV